MILTGYQRRYSEALTIHKSVHRKSQKKYIIPPGLHRLKLKKEITKTKNGANMMIFSFWKPPIYLHKKITFDYINCYHVLINREGDNNFFDKFTTCFTEDDLNEYEGWYDCWVENKEKLFVVNDKIKKHINGEDIIFLEANIASVNSDDNYNLYELYKRIL
jgi:hypothetical protein